MRYLLALLLITSIYSCKKEDTSTNNNGIPTFTINVRDSFTGVPLEGVSFRSYDPEKKVLTDKEGNATITFTTEDEKQTYKDLVSQGQMWLSVYREDHYGKGIMITSHTIFPQKIKLIPFPKYVFDFVNVTGDYMDDSLVFTCSHDNSPQSGLGWTTMLRVSDKGNHLVTQPIAFYTGDLLHTYYSIKYELKAYPGGTVLVSEWLPLTGDGTETHLRVEF